MDNTEASNSRTSMRRDYSVGSLPSKFTQENSFTSDTEQTHSRTRLSNLDRRLEQRMPTMHQRATKWLLWLRGPRPHEPLPEPTPFRDLNQLTGGRTRSVPISIEPKFIRATRPLTSIWLFLLCVPAWIVGMSFLSRAQSFQTPADSFVGCTATFWLPNSGCGLNGLDCAPFEDSTFDFRCPALCDGVILQNPRTVGNEQTVFKPLIVGGGDANRTYRGDSFICAAAAQAGVITNRKGGCATLSLIGNFTNFLPFSANGLDSIGFPSVFPLSFQLTPSTSLTRCTDLFDWALVLNVLTTCLLFFVLRPKPIVLFWCLVCLGYWHIALFSQPRGTPPPLGDMFGTFLPTLFIAYAFWRLAFRFTLPVFASGVRTLEGGIWYLGPFWVGVLTNLTTDRLPVDRLTSGDIAKRSGSLATVIIMVLILAVCVINQVRVIRKTGWLPWYSGWYLAGGLVALVLSQLPGLEFRVHHYIIALALIPGTGFPTRLSAVFQGYLLGTFLNGAAAWGFDSILQTTDQLRRDAPLGSDLPFFLTNATSYNTSVPFLEQIVTWEPLPSNGSWDGYALIVDDVQRYAGPALNYSLGALQEGIPHFFRLAYMAGKSIGDFSMPATLYPNGTFVDPLPGPS